MEEQSQDEIEEQRTLARQKEERRYNRDSGLTREDNFLAEENKPDDKVQLRRWQLAHVLISRPVQLSIVMLVAANSLFIWVELDYEGDNAGLDAVRTMFLIIFTLEILLKLLAFGWIFFDEAFNRLDFFVVLAFLITEIIRSNESLNAVAEQYGPIFVVLRIVRLGRLFRLFTGIAMLRILVASFFKALGGVFWVFCLWILFVYIFALLGRCFIGMDPTWAEAELGSGSPVAFYFGSVPRSFITMMQVITEDGWVSEIGREFYHANPVYFLFFVIYMFLGTFGVLNLLTAQFVDTLQEAREEDTKQRELEERRRKMDKVSKMYELFDALDDDGSKTLSREELNMAMDKLKDPQWDEVWETLNMSRHLFVSYLEYFSADQSTADSDDEREEAEEINYEDFLDKLSNTDEEFLRKESWRVHGEITKLRQKLGGIASSLGVLCGTTPANDQITNGDTVLFHARAPEFMFTDPEQKIKRRLTAGACKWDRHILSVVRSMSVEQVETWLKLPSTGLAKYASIFAQHRITGWVLPHLTDDDLKFDFHMATLGSRKHFHLALEDLRLVCEAIAQEEKTQSLDSRLAGLR